MLDERNHKKFISNLEKSEPARKFIADLLQEIGYVVSIRETNISPTHTDWKKYADAGDLITNIGVIEVKALTCDFTAIKDFPFRSGAIVCAKHSYDLKNPKPVCFMQLNKNWSHLLVIDSSTEKMWYTDTRSDKRYENYKQEFYVCPLKYVEIVSIDFWKNSAGNGE